MRDVQAAYCLGRQPGHALGNVAPYCYCEYEGRGLDPELVLDAWQRLIARHDMLRVAVQPDRRQRVLETAPAVAVHDLRALTSAEIEERIAATRASLSYQPLPYDRWPLFVLELSLLPDERVRLHVGIDLLFCDAWSLRILLRELVTLAGDRAVPRPPLDFSFRDDVVAEMELGNSDSYRHDWSYWSDRIATMPPLPLAVSVGVAVARINHRFGSALSADLSFDRPTIAQLAEVRDLAGTAQPS